MLLEPGPGTGAAAGPTIPVGEALLGRVVDPLGRPIPGLDPPSYSASSSPSGQAAAAAAAAVPLDPQGIKGAASLLHRPAPTIMARKPLCARLSTGVKALDVFHPLAHGQCFGLLGRRGSGKTALALQVIGNQRASSGAEGLRCVYVAIGQVSNGVVVGGCCLGCRRIVKSSQRDPHLLHHDHHHDHHHHQHKHKHKHHRRGRP